VGVKGSGFLNSEDRGVQQSRQYVVGPALEVGLPWNFAVEGNALYSSVRSPFSANLFSGADSWEFPVLGKHYFGRRDSAVRPFASGGYTLRKIWFDDDDRLGITGRSNLFGAELERGPLVAGGAAMKFGRFMLSPEFRYTRWTSRNLFSASPNQYQAVFGILF
jgi:hypothetical protein